MQFLRSFPFTSLNTSFCATPLWFVPLNTTLALHPVTPFALHPVIFVSRVELLSVLS